VSGKALASGSSADSEPVASAIPLSYFFADPHGVCNVFIPESHKPGSTGTAWWRRWIRLEADDSLQVHGIHALPRDVFWAGLANKLETWWHPGQRNMFVLIHGFNVSFEEAAIRAAQIGYDLKVPGEMAFYSWPSHGSTAAYSADEATITASVPHIAQFLHELSERSGAERIHLFVHSMGNRGFLSALQDLVADRRPNLRLGQVFFCAPDEDVRTFRHKVNKYPHEFERRTLLVSPDDQAVFLSQWKHRHNRVGYVPPVTVVDGIETIEVGGFGLLDLGHGYFASAGPVIQDIREAIETGRPASQRKIPRAFENHFAIDIRQH
jgi:esterase/lipase superfamily enzyme